MNPLDVKFKAKIKGIDNKLAIINSLNFDKKTLDVKIPTLVMGGFTYKTFHFEDVEELLQYTGFKDKEGNEIYIGDTLTHSGDIEGLLWVCEFDKFKNLRCKGLNEESTTFSMGNGWYISGGAPFVKVVGNVYRED